MNKAAVRYLSALALAFACVAGSPAQEDAPKPKKAPSKATQEAKTKAWEKKAKERAKVDAEAKAKAVDINHATKDELKMVPGITDAYAAAIIAKRPYKTKADLVTKNAIPFGLYQSLRKKVAAK